MRNRRASDDVVDVEFVTATRAVVPVPVEAEPVPSNHRVLSQLAQYAPTATYPKAVFIDTFA
jgi:hypothetical protein